MDRIPRMSSKKKKQKQNNKKGGSNAAAAAAEETESGLWTALRHDDVDAIRELLFGSGISEDVEDPFPRPQAASLLREELQHKLPLTYAVEQQLSPEVIQLLLRAGASPSLCESTGKNRFNALLQTCWTEDDDQWRLLLEHGKGKLETGLKVADPQGRTPLHVLSSSLGHRAVPMMEEAMAAAEAQQRRAQPEASPSDVLLELLKCQDKEGATPLHTALRHMGPMADYLVEHLEQADPVARSTVFSVRSTKTGETALHYLISSHVGGKENEGKMKQLTQRLLAMEPALATEVGHQGQSLYSLMVTQPHVFTGEDFYQSVLQHMWTKDMAAFSSLMKETDKTNGLGVIHQIIIHKNPTALKALLQFLEETASIPSDRLREEAAWLFDPTQDGVISTEIAATREELPASLIDALVRVGVIDRGEYEELRSNHELLRQEREEEEAERLLNEEDEEEEEEEYNPKAHFKAKQTGPTRAQQSKRVAQKAARELRAAKRALEIEGQDPEEDGTSLRLTEKTSSAAAAGAALPERRREEKASHKERTHPNSKNQEKKSHSTTTRHSHSTWMMIAALVLGLLVSSYFTMNPQEEPH